MIRVEVFVQHAGGKVEVIEIDPREPDSEKHVETLVKLYAERAAHRAICALTAAKREPLP
jgi:hypothetical protein